MATQRAAFGEMCPQRHKKRDIHSEASARYGYCVCGKRFSTTTAKGHTYFFCLGRDKCSEPTVRVESVEEQVESLYEDIRLPEAVLEALESELEGDAKRRAEHRYRLAEKLSGRLRALERERDKTMRAYLDDAISIDMLKREQKRITEEQALRSGQLATLSERIAQTEELVRLALRLVENCQEAYGKASSEMKKLFDKAFSKRLVVQQKKIAQVDYEAPFDTLLTGGFVSDDWRRPTEQIQNSLNRLMFLKGGK